MLGDLVGHKLLQQVEMYQVAGLGAAGRSGSLQRASAAVSRGPHSWCSPSNPAGPWPWPQTYPLVNELELKVALTAVWVGLSARLQRVPLVLPAAEVLGGRQTGTAHAREPGQGVNGRQTPSSAWCRPRTPPPNPS